MTLKQLKEVSKYAKTAEVAIKQERTGYFEHMIIIGRTRHAILDSAIAHIDRLKSNNLMKLRSSPKRNPHALN